MSCSIGLPVRSPSSSETRSTGGFTLIEVVVALVILTVALGALMQLFQTGMRSSRIAEDRVLATLLAQSRLAAVGIESPLEPGEIGGEIDERFRWSALVEPYHDDFTAEPDEEPRAGLPVPYQVTVTVSWGPEDDGAAARSVSLTSLRLGQAEP